MPQRFILMGVSGCGKSVIGRTLADRLGLRFEDADDHHSPENFSKMSMGVLLTRDASQYETLEPPGPDEEVPVRVDDASIEGVLERCTAALRRDARLD